MHETEAAGDKLRFGIQDLASSLANFQYQDFYSYFARVACGVLVLQLQPIDDFLAGVATSSFVPVSEFLKRSAVPSKWSLESQKAFSMASFEQTFLAKAPKTALKFPKGQMPALPCLLLAEWAPIVDALLTLKDMMQPFQKAQGLDEKFKACSEEPKKLADASSDKLTRANQLLDNLIVNLDMLAKIHGNILEKWEWRKTYPTEFGRVKDLSQECSKGFIQTFDTILKGVCSEMPTAFASMQCVIEALHSGTVSDSALKKLITVTVDSNAKSEDKCKEKVDRLLDGPDAYFKAISEPASDFAYMALTRMSGLRPLMQSSIEKATKAAAHPFVMMNATTEQKNDFQSQIQNLQTDGGKGTMAVVQMILADLIDSQRLPGRFFSVFSSRFLNSCL